MPICKLRVTGCRVSLYGFRVFYKTVAAWCLHVLVNKLRVKGGKSHGNCPFIVLGYCFNGRNPSIRYEIGIGCSITVSNPGHPVHVESYIASIELAAVYRWEVLPVDSLTDVQYQNARGRKLPTFQ